MTSNPDNVKPTHQYKWNEDIIDELEIELTKMETLLKKKLETLEKSVTLPQGEETPPPVGPPLLKTTHRIISMLKRYTQAEELFMKENNNLKKQLKRQQYLLNEVEMERDILLQQVHAHLETNSSLRVRLEEQRCQAGALQRELNKDLESRIKSLEREKEQLMGWNVEKEQKLRKMALSLEEATRALKEKETEVLNCRNEEKNLRADLQKALDENKNTEEKCARLKKQVQDFYGGMKRFGDRKSLSVGDLAGSLSFIQKIPPKPLQDCASTLELFKTSGGSWKPNVKATPVQSQLNSLRRDLLNVTRKLEVLKLQLVSSGVIPEEAQPPKNLKRKGNPMEEVSDDQKSEFKDLKHILQDAKNLNAKLQNMREEKQKVIEDRGIESKKKEGKVAEKENDFGQTAHTTGIFKTR